MSEDIVLEIKMKMFGARNIEQKREILRAGRPTPALKNKVGNRKFQEKWYEQIDWLCGSSITEKLYCWPCLLFKPRTNQSWTDGGYDDFKNILTHCKHHSKSLNHLASYKSLKTCEHDDIVKAVSKSGKLAKLTHNKEAEENRQYLKRLTSAVLYLCKQELPLSDQDEGKDSINRGNYRELLHCFAEIDSVFESRLHTKEGSKHFSGVSSSIQNDLIQAIGNVVFDEIRSEVNNAPFMSVQADKTTDYATHVQLSIIIRYVHEAKIYERFIGFYEVSDDKSLDKLTEVIATALNGFDNATNKLVSQTYDGSTVTAGNLGGVQSRLKREGFKYAHFIHCYAHKLNLVLSKSAEKVAGVRMFFSHLRSFNKFVSSSTKRKSILDKFEVSIPSLFETRWCYRTRTVSSVKLLRDKLKNALRSILENNEKWDEDTLCQADNLLAKLNDFTFIFFINCFHNILSQAEKLFDILQCKQLDIKRGQTKINDFMHCIEGYRNNEYYENIMRETAAAIKQENDSFPPAKKAKGAEINFKSTYFEIIDTILMSLRERFVDMKEYAFVELLDVNKFEQFSQSFPMQHIDSLNNKYSNIFDSKSLVSELKYMYVDIDFKSCKSINSVLELIYKLKFTSAMPEAIKLIQLFLTIPLTSVANKRSLSTLDRIRSYLRSTMTQERLSSLARISIEKSLLNELESKKELHDKILHEFAIKPRRVEFMYK